MGTILIFTLGIVFFIGAILISNLVKVKPVPVKVKVDPDRRSR